ncbi:hypothetical protein F5X68DRAFT_207065 [Plectosphaerella plurivora]|uniref:Uncharacterized protein n=1 Tax=Plectosphaerella plurivora TaxID=936078 RepID=A0A9P8VB30_9PEZI|nr:hypothetical protein F5X68DRAFT_207065 [Plectosphaerella plurivora]
MKYIKGQSPGKTPIPQRKIDVESDGLAEFLERQLRKTAQTDPDNDFIRVCLPSGRHVALCMRFEIPVAKKNADETFALLKLSWMALCLASMSGAAEVIDLLNDKPDEDWEEARVRLRDQKRRSLDEWEETQERAEDEARRAQSDSSA